MKKLLGLVLVLVLCMLMTSALADGVSLEEALAMVGQPGCPELIELNDDLANLNVVTSPDYTGNSGKVIVVLREAPQKKYETSSSPYDADYHGVDDGETKTYLHAGIMKDIPVEQRAATVAEIGNVLMGETLYLIDAEISTSADTGEADKASDLVLQLMLAGKTDEAEAMQEMQAQEEAKQEKVYQYTPVFAGYGVVSVYNWEDGSSSILSMEQYPSPEMRDNPEADSYWDMIVEAINIAQFAYAGDIAGAADFINNTAYYLDAATLESMLNMDALQLYMACEEEIWRCAALMSAADGDPDTMKQYETVINARSLDGLIYIAQTRAYNAVGYSDFSIQYSKLYTAEADLEAVKAELMSMAELLADEQINWNIMMLILLFMFSA